MRAARHQARHQDREGGGDQLRVPGAGVRQRLRAAPRASAAAPSCAAPRARGGQGGRAVRGFLPDGQVLDIASLDDGAEARCTAPPPDFSLIKEEGGITIGGLLSTVADMLFCGKWM